MWRTGKAPRSHLILLALLAIGVYAGAERITRRELQPRYKLKIAAAQTALLAQQAVRAELESRGYGIDVTNDPWETGLIGEEHTEITSDRGFNTAKILATNPNAAAEFVEILVDAGVKPGDKVAIGMTGSIPGWNIAVLAACRAMTVTPVIITSVGSSDWGANRPDFTWLDMERVLRERNVLPYKSVAASLGGGGDRGRGTSPEGRRLLREAITRNDVRFIEAATLEGSIAERMRLYRENSGGGRYAVYINIGGGVASLGGQYNNQLIRSGYSRRLPPGNYTVNAVINRMSRAGIPVVNLTEVKILAGRYGSLEVTPERPGVGIGSQFYTERVDVTASAILTAFLAAVVFLVIRIDIRHFVDRGRRITSHEEKA